MTGPLDAKLSSAIGGRSAGMLERAFGMRTVGDLLAHYPRRYVERGELTMLEKLSIGDEVTVVAKVVSVNQRSMRNRKGSIWEVRVTDGTDALDLTFFSPRARALRPGMRAMFAGRVSSYKGAKQLTSPDFELIDDDDDEAAAAAEGDDRTVARRYADELVPIYPATGTVPSWKLRDAMQVVLDTLPPLPDPVTDDLRIEHGVLGFRDALLAIHRPSNSAEWQAARDTLRFHEAFILQAALLRQRAERRSEPAVPRHPGKLLATFDDALPFRLTDDQQTVGAEIERDLAAETPMNRLVQGEVGSGKTLVALRAMLTVVDSGAQAALLAPTEVLAAQHLRSIVATLGPDLAARLRVTLLTGQLSAAERRKATLAAASGGASIVVGTHALLSDRVQFAELALVVVDEQHRFGVDQREALRLKGQASGSSPHVLVLTATPIPRTVAMTVFGDLDTSTIAELPAGRSPIASHVVPLADRPGWEGRIWQRTREELDQGRQAFVVCPAIDPKGAGDPADPDLEPPEDDARPPAAVLPVTEELRRMPVLAGRRIEALHGRMSSEEKDAVMRAFAGGSIDVVVATTVIEVGVDVPNASTMVVLDADRFGVSQLHQLRGRVGRGSVPGLCLFVTAAEQGTVARERVDAVAATTDGFELANVDLELRREGDVLGAAQSGGRSSLKLLRVAKDGDLIATAREAALGILDADPILAGHEALREALDRRLDESEREFLAKG